MSKVSETSRLDIVAQVIPNGADKMKVSLTVIKFNKEKSMLLQAAIENNQKLEAKLGR